jgi:hypothetical protein
MMSFVRCNSRSEQTGSSSSPQQYNKQHRKPWRQTIALLKSPPALRVSIQTPSRRKAFVPKFLSFLSHFVVLVRVAILRSSFRHDTRDHD